MQPGNPNTRGSYDYEGRTVPGDGMSDRAFGSLVVDPMSLELVKGSAVDFVEDLGGAAFRVTNPNAQSGCGCGSSFSV